MTLLRLISFLLIGISFFYLSFLFGGMMTLFFLFMTALNLSSFRTCIRLIRQDLY